MPASDHDPQEADVPEAAVRALTAASRRAARAGHPLVVVQERWLVRIESSQITVLKSLPGRPKVTIRRKTRRQS